MLFVMVSGVGPWNSARWACTLAPPGKYGCPWRLRVGLQPGVATQPVPNLLWAVLFIFWVLPSVKSTCNRPGFELWNMNLGVAQQQSPRPQRPTAGLYLLGRGSQPPPHQLGSTVTSPSEPGCLKVFLHFRYARWPLLELNFIEFLPVGCRLQSQR